MGVGRRMKKQGPPAPLSEAHFDKLKRKKGIPVDDTPAEAPSYKKRRTSKKSEQSPKSDGKANAKGATSRPARKQAGSEKSAPGAPKDGKRVGNSKAKKTPLPESDEEMDDEFGASDLEDEADESELNGEKLGDDFLGSDDSVYDSDQEQGHRKETFVFSDDEDDDEDREEKLTVANIEGLSRKLDKQLEEEAAENEAELREEALQTNIDGDKPQVLGGDDDDDELSSKAKTLLAPDLQMLRTRITETIRVLEDFSNLAEEGRSRVEYTSQLLKDFCSCTSTPLFFVRQLLTTEWTDYGYSEFLAEKLMYVFRCSRSPLAMFPEL